MNSTIKKFSRLTLISDTKKRYGSHIIAKYRCNCGNICFIRKSLVNLGKSKSCGCLRKERFKKLLTKHGLSRSPEYSIRKSMVARCYNKKNNSYKNYGGRGIKVCKRWLKFENFYKDMGPRPNKSFSLERINNNKGYSKSNCKWATPEEQGNNKSNSVFYLYKNKKITISIVSRMLGLNKNTIYSRIKRKGLKNGDAIDLYLYKAIGAL